MKRDGRGFFIALACLVLGLAACGQRGGLLPFNSQATALQPLTLEPDAGGKIKVKPKRLSFAALGSAAAKTVTVKDAGYTGKIKESLKSCKGIVSVAPHKGKGPAFKLKVTPLRNGTCSIGFSDTKKRKGTLPITVATPSPSPSPTTSPTTSPTASPGNVIANPLSATICPATGADACATDSQSVTLSQSHYSGSFNELDNCNNTVARVTGSGSSYTIDGQSATGTCTVTFVGGAGKFTTVGVTVVGAVSASPSPVELCPSTGSDKCNPHTVNVTASQANFSGTFSESDTCSASVASVSRVSAAVFNVTGGSTTGTCHATLTGALGQSVNVPIDIVNGVVINIKKERF